MCVPPWPFWVQKHAPPRPFAFRGGSGGVALSFDLDLDHDDDYNEGESNDSEPDENFDEVFN